MGLTEVPSELFPMKNLKTVDLSGNELCSLPSDIALLTKLEWLYVRFSKRSDRDLTKSHVVSGPRQPARVSSARTRAADQSQGALRAALETDGLDLTLRRVLSAPQQPAEIGQLAQLEELFVRNRIDWLVISPESVL
jgi:Leucine-rich repeat (LRR) protein